MIMKIPINTIKTEKIANKNLDNTLIIDELFLIIILIIAITLKKHVKPIVKIKICQNKFLIMLLLIKKDTLLTY